MKTVTIILLLTLSSQISAIQVFKCYLPINPYNADFEQGKEVFLDVEIKDNKPRLFLYRAYGKKKEIINKSNIRHSGFANDYTVYSIMWDSNYLSMVYLGAKNWGAFLKYKHPESSFPEELELMCSEKTDITLL